MNQLEFVEDSSNQSSKYTRNFFRNEMIPAIEKIFPQVKANLNDNIDRFLEIEKLYQSAVGLIRKKLVKKKANEIHIPVKQLMEFNNRALIYEIIKEYGFGEKQIDDVIKLAESESGKYIQSPENNYRIIRHRHWFIISPVETTESENIIIESTDKEILFSLGKLLIKETTDYRLPTNNHSAMIDSSPVEYPILLRRAKTGDYFYPLGMKKKKKLNRFLIDQKLSKTEKEKLWVLESNKRILWVVGYRIDERFKVLDNSKKILHLQLLPAE